MERKLIILFLIVLMIFTTSCNQIGDNLGPFKEEISNQNTNNVSELENDEQIKYKVENDGGKFSNKDLIYFIMTDRFNDGDETNNNFDDVDKSDPKAFHGGDFKGITEKLDYIKSLGATAIWITPVAKNQPYGYHGYWIIDFYDTDPHFGSLEDLKILVNEAHKRDIKIILDHVVNHTGPETPWLDDPKYKDWFHSRKNISNWNDQNQLENGWLFGLPDLDQSNPEVRNFLLENTLWWIDETGIDGMRLDTMRHVPKEFWNEFAYKIKSKYPDFYLLGEVWNNNPRYLEQYHQMGIDGLTNYSLFEGIRDTFRRFGKTSSLVNAIKKEGTFSNPGLNGIFVDNHDNRRLITEAGEYGEEYLKQALTFVMTYPAIPIIYYGTEIAMEGGDDPDNRRDMEWHKVENSDMLNFYRKLVDLRTNNPALKEGTFKLLDYDAYFMSYMREKDNDSVIVVINVQDKEKNVTINIPNDTREYKDILTGKGYKVVDEKIKLSLKPLDLIVLQSISN